MQLNRKQCNFKLNSYKQMCMSYLLKKIQFWKQLHTYTYSSSLFICYELIIVIKNNLLQNWQLSPWKELLTSFVIVELSLKKKKNSCSKLFEYVSFHFIDVPLLFHPILLGKKCSMFKHFKTFREKGKSFADFISPVSLQSIRGFLHYSFLFCFSVLYIPSVGQVILNLILLKYFIQFQISLTFKSEDIYGPWRNLIKVQCLYILDSLLMKEILSHQSFHTLF